MSISDNICSWGEKPEFKRKLIYEQRCPEELLNHRQLQSLNIPEEEEVVDGVHGVNLNQSRVVGFVERSEDSSQRHDEPNRVKLLVAIGVVILLVENCCHDDVALKVKHHAYKIEQITKKNRLQTLTNKKIRMKETRRNSMSRKRFISRFASSK